MHCDYALNHGSLNLILYVKFVNESDKDVLWHPQILTHGNWLTTLGEPHLHVTTYM